MDNSVLSKKNTSLKNVVYTEDGLHIKYYPGTVLTDEQFEELNPIQKAAVLNISKAQSVEYFSKNTKKTDKKTEEVSEPKETESKTKKSK